MVSEENLELLHDAGASYLVGTPKSMLKRFARELLGEDWTHVEPGVDVKLCRAPDSTAETYVLCRSPQRSLKERAMRERQVQPWTKNWRGSRPGARRPRIRCATPRKPSAKSGRSSPGTAGRPISTR